MASVIVFEEKQPLTNLLAQYDPATSPNAFKKMEGIMQECDFFQNQPADGSSFWMAFLSKFSEQMDIGNTSILKKLKYLLTISFPSLRVIEKDYSRVSQPIKEIISLTEEMGFLDLSTDNVSLIISWLKHVTVGHITEHEDRFNRWFTRDNFREALRNQLQNETISPDDTMIGAFAELLHLTIRIYPLNNAPVDDFISYGFKGEPGEINKDDEMIVLQEDSKDGGYRFRLLYQEDQCLPKLTYNLSDTSTAFNGASSVMGPVSTSECSVPCASKPEGTTTDDAQRPLLAEKEPIENVVAEYNMQASPEFFVKMTDIAKRYRKIRRTRGDGACYWRCLMISIIEKCAVERNYCNKVKEICDYYLKKLVDMGYEHLTVEDFISALQDAMDKMLDNKTEEIFKTIEDQSYHMYYVSALKFITVGYILEHPDDYEMNAIAEGFTTLKEYIDPRIQVFEAPADDIAITASSRVFDLNIRIEYVTRDNRPMSQKGSYYLLPYDDENAVYSVFFLWRPEHYDILYVD